MHTVPQGLSRFSFQGAKLLQHVKKLGLFDRGPASRLPDAYRKFWREWRETAPTAVHYIPAGEEQWQRNEVTGEIKPVQDIPLPLKYPKELNEGIWGGEAVVKGFQKRTPYKRRVPHYWVPVLRRTAVRSEILNVHLSTVVTDRTLLQIHDCSGFDHYILKTPACDLASSLALGLKRKMLIALMNGCPEVPAEKRANIMAEYKQYLAQYTPEEVEWYGLTIAEALKKLQAIDEAAEREAIVPHKVLFRARLLEQLNEAKNRVDGGDKETITDMLPGSQSWLSKMNPFAKKE